LADTFNPLVWLMDVVADAVDWIHETFSDPALSRELRSDLGVDDEGKPQGQLPTGEKIRMRHPNGDPIDVDKAAFDATVDEVRAAYGLMVDFFDSLDLSVAEIWDFLSLIGRVGAAESIRVRWPLVHGLGRATGVVGGLVSQDDVEGLNVLRAVDLLGGKSGAPSDETDPRKLEILRNWLGAGSAITAAIFGDDLPVRVRATYGYEPDLDSKTPPVDLIARTAYTIDASNPHPDGVGTDEHVSLTWIYVPEAGTTPYKLLFATGGGISHTRGRFTTSLEVPAAGSVVISRPWNFEAGDLLRAVAGYGRADARALEFGELDGPHLDVTTIQLRIELSATSSVRLELKAIDVSLALSDADSFISSLSQELKTRFDVALVYDRNGLRFEGGPKSSSTTSTPAALAGGGPPAGAGRPRAAPPARCRRPPVGSRRTFRRASPASGRSGSRRAPSRSATAPTVAARRPSRSRRAQTSPSAPSTWSSTGSG
jgi:hypothetical protein